MSSECTSTKLGKWMLWLALLAIFFLYFQQLLQKRNNPNHAKQFSSMGHAMQIVLEPDAQGHYFLDGQINQYPVRFLLDTGATTIAIPQQLAEQLNLDKQRSIQLHTANGIAQGYTTHLAQLNIAGIELTSISATIAPNMLGDEVLLGMNALKFFNFEQSNRQLTLTFNPTN